METTKRVQLAKQAYFTFRADKWTAIEVTSGAIELYRIDPADGIEMFQGYIQDLKIPGALRLRATQALYDEGALALTYSAPYQLDLTA